MLSISSTMLGVYERTIDIIPKKTTFVYDSALIPHAQLRTSSKSGLSQFDSVNQSLVLTSALSIAIDLLQRLCSVRPSGTCRSASMSSCCCCCARLPERERVEREGLGRTEVLAGKAVRGQREER